jgi:threonine dehydratase
MIMQPFEVWPIINVYPTAEEIWHVDEAEVLRLCRRLLSSGQYQAPIIVEPSGSILHGTLEYMAAKRLGWAEVPVVVVGARMCPHCGRDLGTEGMQ